MNTASLVLIAVLTAGGVAHAQAPNAPADAAYQEGRRLYDLHEWEAAIAKLKEAYRLRPDAPSLFNIAQANRLKGDCAEALSFYRTYKRNFPAEKNIDRVDKFITEMDACVKKDGGKTTVEPPNNPDSVKTEPVKTEPVKAEPVKTEPVKIEPVKIEPTPYVPTSAAPGHGKRVAGLVIGGAGVLGFGISAFFALRARSAANDAEGAMIGEAWDPAIQSSGQSAARDAQISLAVGGALIVTGTILYILGRTGDNEAAQVTVIPQHGGAALVWENTF